MISQKKSSKDSDKNSLLELFLVFARIGTFAFGGGYVMVPMVQSEASEKHDWVPKDKIGEVISISSSMPGAIVMNTSLYVGYLVAGVRGALVALAGCVLPAVAMTFVCVMFMAGFTENPTFQAALRGVIPVVSGLMLAATFKLFKSSVKDYGSLLICILSLVAAVVLTILNFNVINILFFSAILGIVLNITRLSGFALRKIAKVEGADKEGEDK